MNWLARLLGRRPALLLPEQELWSIQPDYPPTEPPPVPTPPPRSPSVEHIKAGNALLAEGRTADAAEHYRQAIEADAQNADGHVNLGFALSELGRTAEALAPLQRAIALVPGSADAHYLLGAALLAQREAAQAVPHLERATVLQPELRAAWRDLGRALHETGQHDRARAALQSGLGIDPQFADLHYYLGNISLHEMKFDEALLQYRQAIAIAPGYAAVHNNLAQALLNLADFEGAVAAARRALALDPSMHVAHSNLLMALSCDARCPPQDYLAEAKRYGEMLMAHAALAGPASARDWPDRSADALLRIGFVSGDLHSHPVGFFLESVLAHWDASRMHAIAYSNHPRHDDLTARLKARFTAWRDIWAMGDDAAAQLIEQDGIDMLIDLSGHSPENRLPLFARRCARVQASWLGYWASTGLPAIDYLLADPVSVPPAHRAHFSEAVHYLPDTRLCFTAPSGPGVPEVSPLPALHNGHVTFGSFQRLTKLNDAVLRVWARVLTALPGSRLRLQSAQMKDAGARAQLLHRLALLGIDVQRVQLVEAGHRIDYLAAHAEVDFILDTFPHSGATTTCEALWMGVPTLTLAGGTLLSRQGASLLGCAGLGDWVADDEDGFVDRALRFAGDLPSLTGLRSTLRARVAASPLFDAPRFTREFQQAVRAMWREHGLDADALRKQGDAFLHADDHGGKAGLAVRHGSSRSERLPAVRLGTDRGAS